MPSILNNLFGGRFTIGELMTTDAQRQARASGCSVSLVNSYLTIKEEGVKDKFRKFLGKDTIKVCYVTLKLSVKSDTGNVHYIFVQLDPDFSIKNPNDNKVRIYCDCKDFQYRSAYILNKRDSLFTNPTTEKVLGKALTESPKRSTNPLCKHSIAALNWVLTNYSQIMQNIL